MLSLKCCQHLSPLSLVQPPLFSSLLHISSEYLSVSFLALSELVAEVHGSETIDQATLILEALLSHVECLLHRHCEGDAEGEDKAAKKEDDVDEVNVVGGATRGADE